MKMWELDSETEENGEIVDWEMEKQREQRGGGETRGELKASHSLSSPAL